MDPITPLLRPVPEDPARAGIAALADACVQCGACLPHCPTYAVARREGESPRGRIRFVRALAEGRPADAALVAQLDDCLACGACERVCPAGVRYGELLDATRALPELRAADTRFRRALRALATRPRAMASLLRIGRLAARVGLAAPVTRFDPRLGTLLDVAAAVPPPALAGGHPDSTGKPADLVLLAGCVGSAVERDTLRDARLVLERLGVRVAVVDDGTCCGALARHAGDAAEADRLAAAARERIVATGAAGAVAFASGCLADWRQGLAGVQPVDDVLDEVLRRLAAASPGLRARAGRVALWVPCTQRNLDAGHAPQRVLATIPGLDVALVPSGLGCCGAAGSHFVDHPHLAGPLREAAVRAILATGADAVATTNTGCRLWLAAGLAAAGRPLPVRHPISWLKEALDPCP
jgi:glycolate oxidase iron-sulfur subunit